MRNPKDKDEVLNSCDYYYEGSFDNDNPICLEIGMGKGQFILNMAINNPNINYIGVEKYSSVSSVAIKKINEYKPRNLKILIGDIASIEALLDKKIDTIYLNFSDPWPKDRHAKRRLTSRQFMARYDVILKPDGQVEFKTDNKDLFDFSLEEIKEAGWELPVVTFDLHNDSVLNEGNVMTEYETRFSQMGNPICKLVAVRNH